MTEDERNAALDQIDELVHKLRFDDDSMDGDPDKGKVIWPVKEDMSYNDAMATCFDFADGELTLSFRSFGDGLSPDDDAPGGLCVSWQGTQLYDDSPGGCYGVQPLKKMLEDHYNIHVEEGTGDAETGRLLAKLIKAFDNEEGAALTEDHNRGKIVWPIAVGECPDIDDAYKTLYSLSSAGLYLSFYDEKGKTLTNELSVEFQNIYEDDDLGRFARKSLKELIEFRLEIHDGEEPQARKLRRLLQVLEEP